MHKKASSRSVLNTAKAGALSFVQATIDLLDAMLCYDPTERLSAAHAMQADFFDAHWEGDSPPLLGTLEAKHTSLAEHWERQKELAHQPTCTRQASKQARRADNGSRPGADSQ